MNNRLLLGIDVGSSSVKASLVNADTGKCEASAFFPESEAPIIAVKAGWAEQDPRIWWENVGWCLKEMNGKHGLKDVKSIGITYQMHGLVCIDEKGNIIDGDQIMAILAVSMLQIFVGRREERS